MDPQALDFFPKILKDNKSESGMVNLSLRKIVPPALGGNGLRQGKDKARGSPLTSLPELKPWLCSFWLYEFEQNT